MGTLITITEAPLKPRRLKVALTGAREDMPRLIQVTGTAPARSLTGARGAAPAGRVRLLLRPRDVEGLALVTKGATAWAWESGHGSDAPGELAAVVDARFWESRLSEAARPGRGIARSVAGGEWKASAQLVDGRIVVELRREWKGHGVLVIQNAGKAWRWTMSKAAVGGTSTGTEPTLSQVCEAGLQAALGFELRPSCSLTSTAKAPRAKASTTPKASTPKASKETKEPKAAAPKAAPKAKKAKATAAPEAPKAAAPKVKAKKAKATPAAPKATPEAPCAPKPKKAKATTAPKDDRQGSMFAGGAPAATPARAGSKRTRKT